MKTLLAVLTLTFISSASFAANIDCNLDVLLADKGGYLMPADKKISLTTEIISSNSEVDFLKQCQSVVEGNYRISLCAQEASFIGGYQVGVLISENDSEAFPTISSATLVTAKKDNRLKIIKEERQIILQIGDKLESADINIPSALEGDSLQVDEAVKKGINKGVLTPNEPVVISIDSCKLLK